MADKKKTRVDYEVEKDYTGAWRVRTTAWIPAETASEAIMMMKSMYNLEDPNEIDVHVTVRSTEAVDILFGLDRENETA
jgi:hypothetical protein